jgi:small subunit ribosomal protein S1
MEQNNDKFDEAEKKLEESVEEENFAELLNKSFVQSDKLEPGQKVKGIISKIGEDWVFIDFGGKSEGYLDKKELLDEHGEISVKEGDTINAHFLSSQNGEQLFTTQIRGGDAGRMHMEEAWRNGIPLEGTVEKEVKGGFEIKVAGSMRGFCPFSQMGMQRVENPSELLGKRLSFKITEYGEKGRNVILSHRAVLEEQRQEQKEALKETLREGMTVKGTITSIREFGAFVQTDGLEGLIPISEISWSRVEDVREHLSVGQEVEVVALKLDWEKDRFSFSLKDTLPNPWDNIEQKYPQGSRHTGTVVRLANFGAFVNLEPGVDGLIHISKLGAGKRIKHPGDVVAKGQEIAVKVESVDKENKRLSLSPTAAEEENQGEERQDIRRYAEETPKSMGTLGDILKAKLAEKGKK